MKHVFITLFSFLLLCNGCLFSQYVEKVWVDKTDSVYGYYTVIKPASRRVQGALVLLDGFGGNADNFLSETKIHNIAWANDLITICIPTGQRLYADTSIIDYLNNVLTGIAAKYHLRKNKFAMGGFSSGGNIALRYTELCHENPAVYPVLPAAVFDIDSPVDLIALYHSSETDLTRNNNGWWLEECRMIIDSFKKSLGDIRGDLKKYHAASPFSKDISGAGNEQYLKSIAVRTYHDMDVNWHIQNRQRSIYETNAANASELINRLVLQGNTKAEFIAAKAEGRRSNGQRHPHAWNIADEINLIQWIKEQLHFFPDHLENKYEYTAPGKWGAETILFPFNFAMALPYSGFEELRFAPGWGDAASNEKWAYTILWWLDDTCHFDEKILQQNIETYFTGLTKSRAIAEKLDLSAFAPAKAQVQKVNTLAGDIATYTATAAIFDAHVTKKPGRLYFKIHVKDCPGKTRTIVLFEVAGNPRNTDVWVQLGKINEAFKCVK